MSFAGAMLPAGEQALASGDKIRVAYLKDVRVSGGGGGGGSGSDSQTSLLAHFNESAIDSSSNAFSSQLSTVQYDSTGKFGHALNLLHSNNYNRSRIDYLNTGDKFDFGSGDFTIEFWIFGGKGAGGTIATYGRNLSSTDWENGTSWRLFFTAGGNAGSAIGLMHRNNNGNWESWSVAPDVVNNLHDHSRWFHIALTRESGTVKGYIDGVLRGTRDFGFSLVVPANKNLSIGDTSSGYAGKIDELRISKGVARYTANFTPPVSPF